MNAVTEISRAGIAPDGGRMSLMPDHGRMSVTEVVRHVHAVQEVMKTVMKEGVHYGLVPGTDKPMLFKQGAEKLCLAFRIADDYRIDDLSTADTARYRVTCVGIHQTSGAQLGQGVGECSSAEEKYRWRKAVCKEEFEATPANLRRIKFGRKSGGHYTVEQVRTDAADLANTVLKMAAKRAKVAMTLNVTAAGDIFSQDLEDLDTLLQQHLVEDERQSHTESLREEWVAKARAATSVDELTRVMKEGVKVFQQGRDRDGYGQFAGAVKERGAVLRGAQQEGGQGA